MKETKQDINEMRLSTEQVFTDLIAMQAMACSKRRMQLCAPLSSAHCDASVARSPGSAKLVSVATGWLAVTPSSMEPTSGTATMASAPAAPRGQHSYSISKLWCDGSATMATAQRIDP